MRILKLASTLLFALSTLAGVAAAQNGDRPGEDQPETWRQLTVPEAPVLDPQAALESFVLAPGFRLELVAAEPLVEDPVAIAWDAEGRLWAVEMRGFMPDVDGTGETEPVGRVVVLEDSDGDGRMDRSTLFVDRLVNPRAIAPVARGVLVAEPPNLWYARDLDGDLHADERRWVASYGDPDPDLLEHTENGLLQALDNWIYNAKSSRRLRIRAGVVEEQRTHFRGQWGIAQDDYGRLFYNTNSRFLLGDFFPSAYLDRNPAALPATGRRPGLSERLIADESVYSVRPNPGVNRGYRPDVLRADGRLAETTSVSGLVVYRGDQFPPEYEGDVFVPEPAANVVAHFELHAQGIELAAEHRLYDDERWGKREFLASTDERFRPVDCAVGPDGALYVVDMYRGIIQHRQFVTTFLRKQILERGLDKPIGLGRIYRVVHEERPLDPAPPDLESLPDTALVGELAHANGWRRDTAQRLLVERGGASAEAVAVLRTMAATHENALARIHALWTLDGLSVVDAETTLAALASRDAQVGVAALRTAEPLLRKPEGAALRAKLAELTPPVGDPVRLQLLFTLGELPANAASAILGRMELDASDRWERLAALSGLARRELDTLERVVAEPAWHVEAPGRTAWLGELAAAATRRLAAESSPADRLLAAMAAETTPAWQRRAIAEGVLLAAGEPGYERLRLSSEAPPLQALDEVGLADLAPRLGRAFTAGDQDAEGAAEPITLDTELLRLGRGLYTQCARCHQADGSGQEGIAPRLVHSPWVLESEERIARIVLHGMQGPLAIDGETWDELMPGYATDPRFSDEATAALLTYLRTSWGHRASPVTPETVRRIRAATADRTEPWTVEELDRLEK